jgi:hypothetical protein
MCVNTIVNQRRLVRRASLEQVLLQSPLAENQYGFLSWMWHLNAISEDEIMDECGMDALCVLRLLWMGFKICALSAVNAIWLMPLYALSPEDDETRGIIDPIVQLTVGNVPAGSSRFVGTVIAAYILFGYVMHQVLREFEWFIQKRHEYLKKPVVENYSVYVRNVPSQYRSNEELQKYFASCYSNAAVVEPRFGSRRPNSSLL